ncbi:MAG: hypothetical protein AB7T63_08640 [Planctomycetota bacterium]
MASPRRRLVLLWALLAVCVLLGGPPQARAGDDPPPVPADDPPPDAPPVEDPPVEDPPVEEPADPPIETPSGGEEPPLPTAGLPPENEVPDGPPVAEPPVAEPPAPAVAEDVVVLTNGSEWRGRICRESDDEVELESVGESGSIQRVTLPRVRIAEIRRAPRDGDAPAAGVSDEDDAWFLLQAEGRVVGWRNVRIARVTSSRFTGWRMEEEILELSQGRHLPATRTRRVEVVDEAFRPRLFDYRESTEGEGADRYERRVTGEVREGVWHVFASQDGDTRTREVALPEGARGLLAWRESMRRAQPRRIGLEDGLLVDPAAEGIVPFQAGFVSTGTGADEWHRVREGRRLVSRFDAAGKAVSEEIAEGLVARPSSSRRCLAAEAGEAIGPDDAAADVGTDPGTIVHLPDVGLAFDRPDASWEWRPSVVDASRTGWRQLGLLAEPRRLLYAHVEWHPAGDGAPAPGDEKAWLLRRLRTQAPDLVELPTGLVPTIPGALRLDLVGTITRRSERVRTIALMVPRPRGLVVILAAGPESGWAQGSEELERFLQTLRLL